MDPVMGQIHPETMLEYEIYYLKNRALNEIVINENLNFCHNIAILKPRRPPPPRLWGYLTPPRLGACGKKRCYKLGYKSNERNKN